VTLHAASCPSLVDVAVSKRDEQGVEGSARGGVFRAMASERPSGRKVALVILATAGRQMPTPACTHTAERECSCSACITMLHGGEHEILDTSSPLRRYD
jgi:hypothetical protein